MAADRQEMWRRYANHHLLDRESLFAAAAQRTAARSAPYPGSFIDIAASNAFPDVTIVDIDRRAAAFFADEAAVRRILADLRPAPDRPRFRFIHADYRDPLCVPPMDLLISLYAGPVSHHSTDWVRVGGHLLAGTSHGDVTLALRDPRCELVAVLLRRGDHYDVRITDLTVFTTMKGTAPPTDDILRTCRGGSYRRPAAAYLFRPLA